MRFTIINPNSAIRFTVNGRPVYHFNVRGLIAGNGNGGTNPYFEKTLPSVFSQIIPSAEHGLTKIRGVTILTPGRAEMEVFTEIRSNQDVYIEALTNLNNHVLILF